MNCHGFQVHVSPLSGPSYYADCGFLIFSICHKNWKTLSDLTEQPGILEAIDDICGQSGSSEKGFNCVS